MKGFKSKQEFEDWAYEQFDRYGVHRPERYSEEELIYLNPNVPVSFIKEHVRKRDSR